MHGRVKVIRTSEQERALKEKKLNKCLEHKMLCDKLWQYRLENLYNDDQLSLTSSLLETSTDTATFWNYRREILQNKRLDTSVDRDKLIALMKNELDFIANCLTRSPKSYAAWFHRTWVMKNHPDPNWSAELEFCNRCLGLDERNFHCWDYRRFVVCRGKISPESELKYTTLEIEKNFSNYSAWHYRSELLASSQKSNVTQSPFSAPPSKKDQKCARNGLSLLCGELDYVHNALYTDPSDQSPWFYYWWLLGHGERKVYLRELYLSRALGRLVLVFTAEKSINTLSQLDVSIKIYPPNDSDGDFFVLTPEAMGGWNSTLDGGVSAVWWLPITQDIISYHVPEGKKDLYQSNQWRVVASVCVRAVNGSVERKTCKDPECPDDHFVCLHCTMDFNQQESVTRVSLNPVRLLNSIVLPNHDPEDLVKELSVIRDLATLEPNNKWILLTLINLLRFIRPDNYDIEVNVALNNLIEIDAKRCVYYEDLRSAFACQDALVSVYNDHIRDICLKNLGLNSLYYLDWYTLMTRIDLSNNAIKSLPDAFAYLLCLLELDLDDNELSNLDGISRLPSLTHLSVQRNKLSDFEAIDDLFHSESLRVVYINGNKVVELEDLTKKLSGHPGFKRQGQSLSLVYDKTIHS